MRALVVSLLLCWSCIGSVRADPRLGAAAVNETGLKVVKGLIAKSERDNVLISPLSIVTALAMTSVGAGDKTLDEMRSVLALGTDDGAIADSLRHIVRSLDAAATDAAKAAQGSGGGSPLEWSLANRLFGDVRIRFRPEFLAFVEGRYGAPLESIDLRGDSERARSRINGWVEECTRERIRDLIPPGALSRETVSVLVNALYLKAAWAKPFVVERTESKPFYREGGDPLSVPMMRRTDRYGYAHDPRFVGVTVPYLFGDLQGVFLIPQGSETATDLMRGLTGDDLARLARSEYRSVDLSLPGFRVQSGSIDLGGVLQRLGLERPFDVPPGSAEFSRMIENNGDRFSIGAVFHKTFVAVDEAGTEAAAATAVMMLRSLAVPEAPISVAIDRPFVFAIQHRGSGACLFLGVIQRPE